MLVAFSPILQSNTAFGRLARCFRSLAACRRLPLLIAQLLDDETERVKAAFADDDLLLAKEITMRMVYFYKIVKLVKDSLPP